MRRVAPASVSYVMNDMLKDVLEYGTAVLSVLWIPSPVCGRQDHPTIIETHGSLVTRRGS